MRSHVHLATQEWAAASFSADELATLRSLIRTHEQRLQGLTPTVLTAAIVEAVYADVVATPSLAAALRRASRIGALRKQQHAKQN